MRKERISEAISNIDTKHIEEAMAYQCPVRKKRFYRSGAVKGTLAAVLCICIVMGAILYDKEDSAKITAYAYATDKEIGSIGISTGKVNTDGSMTGAPVRFYLKGEDIKTVRFSVKNQWIDFTDWTEKRDEYGVAKNFTVSYGKDTSDYPYLVINWEPNELWTALNEGTEVAELPQELREDLIVLEITFLNGDTENKAVTIKLGDDGVFMATFTDYTITEQDTFINREDSKPVDRTALYNQAEEDSQNTEQNVQGLESLNDSEIEEATNQALEYYKETVFEAVSIEPTDYDGTNLVFTVCVKKDGEIQNPDRMIILQYKGDCWTVVNEGY